MTDAEAVALYRARIDKKWNEGDPEIKGLANEVRKVLTAKSHEAAIVYLTKLGWIDPIYCAKALRSKKQRGVHAAVHER